MHTITFLCCILVVRSVDSTGILVSLGLEVEPMPISRGCVNGQTLGLTNTSVLLSYRFTTPQLSEWMFLAELSPRQSQSQTLDFTLHNSSVGFQFRLLQLEHGGDSCNCWLVTTGRLNFNTSQTEEMLSIVPDELTSCVRSDRRDQDGEHEFCGGLARDARGVLSKEFFVDHSMRGCPGDSSTELLTPHGPPTVDRACSSSNPHMVVSYGLYLDLPSAGGCKGVEYREEAIEFAMRTNTSNDGRWIPLRLSYFRDLDVTPAIFMDTIQVRGYNVPTYRHLTAFVQEQVVMCNDLIDTSSVQFRWMGTVNLRSNGKLRFDVWALASVTAVLVTSDENITLIQETFNSDSLNTVWWMNPRGGSVTCEACTDTPPCTSQSLVFNAEGESVYAVNVTGIAITNEIPLSGRNLTSSSTTTTLSVTPSSTPPISMASVKSLFTLALSITSMISPQLQTSSSSPTITSIAPSSPTLFFSITSMINLQTSSSPPLTTMASSFSTLSPSITSMITTQPMSSPPPANGTSSSFPSPTPIINSSFEPSSTSLTPQSANTSSTSIQPSSTLLTTTMSSTSAANSSSQRLSPTPSGFAVMTTESDSTQMMYTVSSITTTSLSPVTSASSSSPSPTSHLPSPTSTSDYSLSTQSTISFVNHISTSSSTAFASTLTVSINSMTAETMETPTPTVELATDPPTAETTSTRQSLVQSVINMIKNDERLMNITVKEPQRALKVVNTLTSSDSELVEPVVVVYLLADILDRLNVTEDVDSPQQFVESFVEIGGNIAQKRPSEVDRAVVGGTLLQVLDRVAFEVLPESGNVSTENIIIQAMKISRKEGQEEYFTTIDSVDFEATTDSNESDPMERPQMTIQIPSELLRVLKETGLIVGEEVRAVSFLYFNVEDLFPSGLSDEDNSSTLASGIVSTALQCRTGRCPTDNLTLSTPVIITIQHSEIASEDYTTLCVFWDFQQERSEDTLLSTGGWSDSGCTKNEGLSSVSVTVCECNHLTHFAILLSPAPVNTSAAVTLSLRIIGYAGVSVSLVAMAVTIFTFIILKPLRNMRNYIHINLCISLGIAQIIFVAGIDRSSPGDVPIHCRAIAVLLHYFFLVSFMWMLMEGVVLYVVLVRVFVKKTKMYMLAFTLASYGIPLLYLGGLTLPLGFALDEKPHYGYEEACFLKPATHFIWAFISPVILIILLNFVFFIIVARVMWRHQKKFKENTKKKNAKTWLRATISLVVIMGLTWIFGVLIVEVEALLPLAYIYTILVAFQGLWIFLIFVLFSPQVRDAYKKWWRVKVNESDFLSKHFGETVKTSLANSSGIKSTIPRSDLAPSCMELEKKDPFLSTNGDMTLRYGNTCETFLGPGKGSIQDEKSAESDDSANVIENPYVVTEFKMHMSTST